MGGESSKPAPPEKVSAAIAAIEAKAVASKQQQQHHQQQQQQKQSTTANAKQVANPPKPKHHHQQQQQSTNNKTKQSHSSEQQQPLANEDVMPNWHHFHQCKEPQNPFAEFQISKNKKHFVGVTANGSRDLTSSVASCGLVIRKLIERKNTSSSSSGMMVTTSSSSSSSSCCSNDLLSDEQEGRKKEGEEEEDEKPLIEVSEKFLEDNFDEKEIECFEDDFHTTKIRIFIADDFLCILNSLKLRLYSLSTFHLIGEIADKNIYQRTGTTFSSFVSACVLLDQQVDKEEESEKKKRKRRLGGMNYYDDDDDTTSSSSSDDENDENENSSTAASQQGKGKAADNKNDILLLATQKEIFAFRFDSTLSATKIVKKQKLSHEEEEDEEEKVDLLVPKIEYSSEKKIASLAALSSSASVAAVKSLCHFTVRHQYKLQNEQEEQRNKIKGCENDFHIVGTTQSGKGEAIFYKIPLLSNSSSAFYSASFTSTSNSLLPPRAIVQFIPLAVNLDPGTAERGLYFPDQQLLSLSFSNFEVAEIKNFDVGASSSSARGGGDGGGGGGAAEVLGSYAVAPFAVGCRDRVGVIRFQYSPRTHQFDEKLILEQYGVVCAEISRCAQLLIVGDSDGVIRVLDLVRNGRKLAVLPVSPSPISRIRFYSPSLMIVMDARARTNDQLLQIKNPVCFLRWKVRKWIWLASEKGANRLSQLVLRDLWVPKVLCCLFLGPTQIVTSLKGFF